MNSSFKKDIFRIDFAPLLENALVAQLDRVSASEAEGCGFDPRRARQNKHHLQGWFFNSFGGARTHNWVRSGKLVSAILRSANLTTRKVPVWRSQIGISTPAERAKKQTARLFSPLVILSRKAGNPVA